MSRAGASPNFQPEPPKFPGRNGLPIELRLEACRRRRDDFPPPLFTDNRKLAGSGAAPRQPVRLFERPHPAVRALARSPWARHLPADIDQTEQAPPQRCPCARLSTTTGQLLLCRGSRLVYHSNNSPPWPALPRRLTPLQETVKL